MKISILYATLLNSFFLFSVTWAIPCNNQHTVRVGESCKSIIRDAQITAESFFQWNPSLKNGNCVNLHAGQIVCLGQSSPTKTANITNTVTNNTTTANTLAPTSSASPQPSKTKKKHKAKPSPSPTYFPGLTVTINDESQFCLLLPPSPGNSTDAGIDTDAIANSEKNAIVFCTEEDLTPGAKLMPDGFITSAHYQFNTTSDFVQVTGEIDREKYSLSENDGGGQYDNHGAGSPPLSMCLGYRYYVSLIEPDIQGFCIRCCHTYEDCNASRSAYGCKRVIPTLDFSV
ncbi:unnamed protein product [Absidia cylindrospora]